MWRLTRPSATSGGAACQAASAISAIESGHIVSRMPPET